jgi:hypothetical protein
MLLALPGWCLVIARCVNNSIAAHGINAGVATPLVASYAINNTANYPDAGDACNLADISPAVNGSIALMRRGGCYYGTKAANLLAVGAVGGRLTP